MINIDNDGTLVIKNNWFHLCSDSVWRDFSICFFKRLLIVMTSKEILTNRYMCVELSLKFLPDFYYCADIGDVEFEFANVVHHEES